MTRYGQFCPVAKSSEILGNPWSVLIVRELLLGSQRFSELQQGLPRISPTVLTTRLKELEAHGVLVRRKESGRRGHSYRLTAAGRELAPVVDALAVWGMRWARYEMAPEDMDVTFLMFDIERRIDVSALPDGQTVFCFQFPDLEEFSTWWITIDGGERDLCYEDPGRDVDLYLTARSTDLIAVWMGDTGLARALDDGRLAALGDAHLRRTLAKWFPLSAAAAVPRPTPTERAATA